MPKSRSDLILISRQKSNTQRSKFVDDDEVGGYVEEGRAVLRDLVVAADPSYYHKQVELAFNNPVGVPLASAALPSDIYKLRGVSQNPDTDNARPIHPLAFADRDGRGYRKAGYTLDGDYLTVVPRTLVGQGPIRLYYTPKLLPLASPIPVSPTTPNVEAVIPVVADVDNVTANSWSFSTATIPGTAVGKTLLVGGCTHANNNGRHLITFASGTGTVVTDGHLTDETFGFAVTADLMLFSQSGGTWSVQGLADLSPKPGDLLVISGSAYNDGARPILTVPTSTEVTTDPTGLTDETFGPNVSISIQPAGTVPTLDVTLDNFDSFITTFAAIRIATKAQKTDLVAMLEQQLAADEGRVNQMAAVRAGECESIPVMWHEAGNVLNPWGGGWE